MKDRSGSKDTFLLSLPQLVAGGSIFGAFLYYLGRQQTDAYYQIIGVPPSALDFGTADYMYQGVQSWMFLVALLFTLVLILWCRVYTERGVQGASHKGGFRKRLYDVLRRFPQYLGIWMFLYMIYAVTLVFGLASLFGVLNYQVKALLGFLIGAFAFVMALILMTDAPTMDLLRTWHGLRRVFLVTVVVGLLIAPQILPASVGTMRGLVDASHAEQVFPTVEVVARGRLGPPDLQWQYSADSYFTSEERLLLIVSTDTQLFLRRMSGSDSVFSVPAAEIVGLRAWFPGRGDRRLPPGAIRETI